MTTKHPARKRYPPELRERALRMARDAIAEQAGQTFGWSAGWPASWAWGPSRCATPAGHTNKVQGRVRGPLVPEAGHRRPLRVLRELRAVLRPPRPADCL